MAHRAFCEESPGGNGAGFARRDHVARIAIRRAKRGWLRAHPFAARSHDRVLWSGPLRLCADRSFFRTTNGQRLSRSRHPRALLSGRDRRADLAGTTLKTPIVCSLFLAAALAQSLGGRPIGPPPAGKLYQGFFYSAPTPGSHDANEHNVTAADVKQFETALGANTSWVYFSDNWFESREFPAATCEWIRSLGKVPYIRL